MRVRISGEVVQRAEAAGDAEKASFVQSLRSTTATAFAEFYNFSRAISWITWYARFDLGSLDADQTRSYERETHETIPKLQVRSVSWRG